MEDKPLLISALCPFLMLYGFVHLYLFGIHTNAISAIPEATRLSQFIVKAIPLDITSHQSFVLIAGLLQITLGIGLWSMKKWAAYLAYLFFGGCIAYMVYTSQHKLLFYTYYSACFLIVALNSQEFQ